MKCYHVFRPTKGHFFTVLAVFLLLSLSLSGLPRQAIVTITQKRSLPIYSVNTSEKVVALGINCAWGDEDIDDLLALLRQHEVRASFFVTGTFCRKFPESVRAIYDAGHEVGSHSNTHRDLAALGEAEILEEIRLGNQEIAAITGVAPKLFRTPSGSYNNLVIDLINREGMVPIQWDADSIDYKNPTAAQMQERILAKLRPGSITLFHAGAKNTPGALPMIIEAVRQQGYTFVPIGEMIHPAPYTLDFEGRQSPAAQ